MNKILIIIILSSMILFTGCTLQSGYTRDKLHGYDYGILWNHLYLLNDHSTVYCFKDDLIPVIESINNNDTIQVYYESYLVYGILCSSGQSMESVVITDIKIIGDD
jgi:hypothetical protein